MKKDNSPLVVDVIDGQDFARLVRLSGYTNIEYCTFAGKYRNYLYEQIMPKEFVEPRWIRHLQNMVGEKELKIAYNELIRRKEAIANDLKKLGIDRSDEDKFRERYDYLDSQNEFKAPQEPQKPIKDKPAKKKASKPSEDSETGIEPPPMVDEED